MSNKNSSANLSLMSVYHLCDDEPRFVQSVIFCTSKQSLFLTSPRYLTHGSSNLHYIKMVNRHHFPMSGILLILDTFSFCTIWYKNNIFQNIHDGQLILHVSVPKTIICLHYFSQYWGVNTKITSAGSTDTHNSGEFSVI